MRLLRFLVARARGSEPALARLARPEADLMDWLAGSRVALVGNAQRLAQGVAGAEIDAADLVLRINGAPMPDARSHGRRTDGLLLSTPLAPGRLAELAPSRVVWMTPRRRRLPWDVARHPGFHLYPADSHAALAQTVGSDRPTTGLMAIDWLSRSGAAGVDLWGFDFFDSLSLSGNRSAAQVPHDFRAERAFVEALVARDPRFVLHR